MEELKDIIAHNLVRYRKSSGLTQQELADKINYSDKAVSKWERAEGMPDVAVLKALADIYDVTVNDFLVMPDVKPAKPYTKARKAKHWLISMLSFFLVWFIATIVMAIGLIVDKHLPMAEYAYIVALPVSMIVLVVFSCIWGKLWMQAVSVSALVWSVCVLVHVLLSPLLHISDEYAWTIYLAGAALQLLVILWYLLRFFMRRPIKIDNIHGK